MDPNTSALNINKFVEDFIHDFHVNHFFDKLLGGVLGNILKYI
jgi:hypothetical protein